MILREEKTKTWFSFSCSPNSRRWPVCPSVQVWGSWGWRVCPGPVCRPWSRPPCPVCGCWTCAGATGSEMLRSRSWSVLQVSPCWERERLETLGVEGGRLIHEIITILLLYDSGSIHQLGKSIFTLKHCQKRVRPAVSSTLVTQDESSVKRSVNFNSFAHVNTFLLPAHCWTTPIEC